MNQNLRLDFNFATTWFHGNSILLNPGKCHFIATSPFVGKIIENRKEETILGVFIDNKPTCYNHIKILCKKALHKILA